MIRHKKQKGYLYACNKCSKEYKTWDAYWKHTQNPKVCDIINRLKHLEAEGWRRVGRAERKYVEKNSVDHRWEVTRQNQTATAVHRYEKEMFVREEIEWLLRNIKGDCLHFVLSLVRTDETFLPALLSIRELNGEREALHMCL